MPNFGALAVANESLKLIEEVGLQPIVDHDAALALRLREGLRNLGVEFFCPSEDTPRSSIVAFECDNFSELGSQLATVGTTVWARDGRVRIAPHSYNREADIDTVLTQLSEFGVKQG